LDVHLGSKPNYNIAIASAEWLRKNQRTIVAVFSALKNKVKPKASAKKTAAKKGVAKKAPVKKTSASKSPVKKATAKKSATKKSAPVKKAPVKKIELKKDLTAKDVQTIVDTKNAVLRHNEVLAELELRGITSINRIPKKVDKDLVDEARSLAAQVPLMIEKLRKAGLGAMKRTHLPSRHQKKMMLQFKQL